MRLSSSLGDCSSAAKGELPLKVTPILYVQEIEPSLPFWVERLGFEKTVEVPEGDKLGFVILVRQGYEVMLQTVESLKADRGGDLAAGTGSASLFIEVDDFAEFRSRLEGAEVVLPERVAFYGMREMAVREPGGHVVCIAALERAA
jgi:uncharacterized glyoxalase superfamily protein PhnB